MAQKQKKETLPARVDVDLQNGGTITYATEVIATIAGVAANEVEGIAGMCVSGGIGEILSRNRNITKGVKVEVGSQEAAVDLFTMVEYGYPIPKVAGEVQENVRKALESLTGLHVVRVDVHVQGVSFEKEKRAAQSNLEAGRSAVLTAAEKPAEPEQPADNAPAKEQAGPAAEAPEVPEAPEAEPANEAPAAEAPDAETAGEIPAAEAPEAPEAEPAAEPVPEDALNETEDFNAEVLREEAALEGETKEKPKRAPGRKRC